MNTGASDLETSLETSSLNEPQIRSLLQRCRQQHRLWQFWKFFSLASKYGWPGLVVLMAVIIAAKNLFMFTPWLFVPALLWIAVSCLLAWRQRQQWQLSRWLVPAYVDHHSGAKGSLLYRFETGQDNGTIPAAARNVKLPTHVPPRWMLTWLALIGGFTALYFLQIEPGAASRYYVPQPIENVENLINRLKQEKPRDEFVKIAEKTLNTLKSRKEGLKREDFNALQRLKDEADKRMQRQTANREQLNRALANMDQLLENLDSGKLNRQQLQQLTKQLQQSQQALAKSGMDTKDLQSLLQQMKKSAAKNTSGQNGKGQNNSTQNGHGKQSFSKSDVEKLKKQLQQGRQRLSARLAKGKGAFKGGAGVNRGPGNVPLDHDHRTFTNKSARFTNKRIEQNADNHTQLLGFGLSRRPESGVSDPAAINADYDRGNTTPYWQKRRLPKHRATIEAYFRHQP